jgi:hypothetical protein
MPEWATGRNLGQGLPRGREGVALRSEVADDRRTGCGTGGGAVSSSGRPSYGAGWQ